MNCIVCGRALTKSGVCRDCAFNTGVMVLPPPRRRAAPCIRCNHAKLIRVIPRELSVQVGREGYSPESNVAVYGPMYATYQVKRRSEENLFAADETVVDPATPREGFGVFEAYICRQCGFVDWYCQDPHKIPIGPEYMTEDVDVTSAEPYR